MRTRLGPWAPGWLPSGKPTISISYSYQRSPAQRQHGPMGHIRAILDWRSKQILRMDLSR
jgi:hypothetical protein